MEGDPGKYGGTVTLIKNIPVGVLFYVYNGDWTGDISEIEGKRYLYVRETGETHEITPERENDYLEI